MSTGSAAGAYQRARQRVGSIAAVRGAHLVLIHLEHVSILV